MPDYFKIRQGNQGLRPASATCDFRISHGTANSASCTSPAALPWLCENYSIARIEYQRDTEEEEKNICERNGPWIPNVGV